jgi:diacylglycerol kinase
MQDDPTRRKRPFARKFTDAFRGVPLGVRGQGSFRVHFAAAAAVIAAAVVMQLGLVEWCVLVVCMAVVLGAEMFNSALESLARAITDEHDPHVRDALDIGSAAVLVAAAGAAVAGAIVFVHRLGEWARWWE